MGVGVQRATAITAGLSLADGALDLDKAWNVGSLQLADRVVDNDVRLHGGLFAVDVEPVPKDGGTVAVCGCGCQWGRGKPGKQERGNNLTIRATWLTGISVDMARACRKHVAGGEAGLGERGGEEGGCGLEPRSIVLLSL